MAYTPRVFTKNIWDEVSESFVLYQKTAETIAEDVELRWDGWAPGTPLPPKPNFTLQQEAELEAIYVPRTTVETGRLSEAALAASIATEVQGRVVGVETDSAAAIKTNTTPDADYAWTFRSRLGRRLLAAFRNNGTLTIFKGLEIGSTTLRPGISSEYLQATIGPAQAGRAFRPLAEDAYLANGTKPQWVLDRWATRLPPRVIVPTVINVRPTPGAGEYATPRLANAAITDSGPLKPYIIRVFPGDYTTSVAAELNWIVKDHVSIIGTERDACIIGGALPNDASDSDITNLSTIQLQATAALANLTITARNLRYTVHAESSGAVKDYLHTVDNCTMIHYGNQDAMDWRTANPGSGLLAANVWAYVSVWGYGASSGGRQIFRNSKFISGSRAWYIHDREDWTTGGEHIIEGCEFYSRNPSSTIDLESLGSGRETTVRASHTAFNALSVKYNDSPWISQSADNQVANHAQIRAVIGGLEPIGFQTTCRGRALRIESSNSTASSTVRITGTAATALMGIVFTRDLGWGVSGYAFGRWDNSGILVGLASNVTVSNKMGKRLGDCTTTPKTMSVVVNGGAPIVVTFSGNHTTDSDTTILALINAALGATATASLYDVVAGEEYPSFPDREMGKVNVSASTIPRWSAVKRSAHGIVPVGTGDPASAFYGVTLEPITPGQVGRILTSGRLQSASQIRGISGSIALGANIYLSDTTAGAFSATGTRVAMTGSHTAGWAEF